MIKKIQDLRFNITKDMNNTMIQMLLVNQMLTENKNLTKKERKLLEKHKNELLELFRIEFRKNNKKQLKIYDKLMDKSYFLLKAIESNYFIKNML